MKMHAEVFYLIHNEAPKSLNAGGAGSRRHWGAAHREKMKWQEIYGLLLLEANAPRGMRSCTADVTIAWKQRKVGGRERDSTNYIAPVIKPFADTLVEGRWLLDDTDEFFKFGRLWFEYPDPWPSTDPRVKAILTIRLTAIYSGSTGCPESAGAPARD